ncbi:hypothetical protein B0T26DRAFT_370044 [Lasiosphaeria miniovina]|uniref:Uncharacterized protein n=1 Tax=Lasiosphaeria miniovina TaxID=1954250 RepID=A0AA40ADC7_9PEZI|nr:uncharacterized protein B0T26DRAFT_370044 [Lasiosphaeria miniovina]KAK0713740.1 hypothetical protein B0T26DRAFT_370044 [Lasiosphaeria miniovina]
MTGLFLRGLVVIDSSQAHLDSLTTPSPHAPSRAVPAAQIASPPFLLLANRRIAGVICRKGPLSVKLINPLLETLLLQLDPAVIFDSRLASGGRKNRNLACTSRLRGTRSCLYPRKDVPPMIGWLVCRAHSLGLLCEEQTPLSEPAQVDALQTNRQWAHSAAPTDRPSSPSRLGETAASVIVDGFSSISKGAKDGTAEPHRPAARPSPLPTGKRKA